MFIHSVLYCDIMCVCVCVFVCVFIFLVNTMLFNTRLVLVLAKERLWYDTMLLMKLPNVYVVRIRKSKPGKLCPKLSQWVLWQVINHELGFVMCMYSGLSEILSHLL